MSGRTHKGATKTKQKQNRVGPNKTGIKQARAKQNSRDSRTDSINREAMAQRESWYVSPRVGGGWSHGLEGAAPAGVHRPARSPHG